MNKITLDNGINVYKFDNLSNISFLEHGFTDRYGGFSQKPFDSLNLGLNTGDDEEAVNSNIIYLTKSLGVEKRKIILTNQIHDDRIHIVGKFEKSDGIYKICKGTDGLATEFDNSFLMTFYADCNPLFFADQKNKVIAISHAGWKGTLMKFGKTTVEFLIENFGSKVNDIYVGIGPSSGKCCYEVGGDVVDQFKMKYDLWDSFVSVKDDKKYLIDLKFANKLSIMETGVPEKNIEVSEICTICNDDFFSYRREGKTGRMTGFMYIK